MVYVIQVLLTARNLSAKQKIKLRKLVYLVGFIIRIYDDARSHESQNHELNFIFSNAVF